MQQVKIGPQFFAREIRVYRDPLFAWHREVMQNAVDSGASIIDIQIGEIADGVQRVTYTDNGCGMTRDQLTSVYFTLGETTKSGGSRGGFGKARLLTCFAQRSYELWTGNLHVTGCGADYEITEVDTSHKGVKIQVDVFTDGRDLKGILLDYLKRSRIDARVLVNGERFTDWTHRRHKARELSFANVYTNKQKASELLVWVDGTLMFVRATSVGQQVIVDIPADKSRDILQANRDGLVMEHQDELDAFIRELDMNKRSALTKKKSKSTAFSGTGTFKARRKPKVVPQPMSRELDSAARLMVSTGLGEGRVIQPPPKAYDTGLLQENDRVDAGLNLFDVILEDETDNPNVRSKIQNFDPRNWDLGEDPVRRNVRGEYRRGIGYLKLLLVWKTACEIAVEQLFEVCPGVGDEIDWGVGWVFSDSAEAKCCHRNGTHFLLLNPCNKEGTLAWSLSDTLSLSKLIATAIHEVVHVFVPHHDEDFANVQTDLTGPIFDIKTEVMKRLKDAKSDEAVSRLFKPAYVY